MVIRYLRYSTLTLYIERAVSLQRISEFGLLVPYLNNVIIQFDDKLTSN